MASLGTTLRTLKNLCRDNVEALDAIDRATVGERGGNNPEGRNQYSATDEAGDKGVKNNNVMFNLPTEETTDEPVERSNEPVQGNSADYALRKLRKERPDLHEKVLAKALKPHAAMVEAGFRKKTVTVPVGAPDRAAKALVKAYGLAGHKRGRSYRAPALASVRRTYGKSYSLVIVAVVVRVVEAVVEVVIEVRGENVVVVGVVVVVIVVHRRVVLPIAPYQVTSGVATV